MQDVVQSGVRGRLAAACSLEVGEVEQAAMLGPVDDVANNVISDTSRFAADADNCW